MGRYSDYECMVQGFCRILIFVFAVSPFFQDEANYISCGLPANSISQIVLHYVLLTSVIFLIPSVYLIIAASFMYSTHVRLFFPLSDHAFLLV